MTILCRILANEKPPLVPEDDAKSEVEPHVTCSISCMICWPSIEPSASRYVVSAQYDDIISASVEKMYLFCYLNIWWADYLPGLIKLCRDDPSIECLVAHMTDG
jgi:hypothetical protein